MELVVCPDSSTTIINTDAKVEPKTQKLEDVIASGRTSGRKSVKHETTHSSPNIWFNGQRPDNVLALGE
jgi:hypothetical protein